HCLAFSRGRPSRYLVAAGQARYGESTRPEVLLWDLTDVRSPVRLPYAVANGAAFDPTDDDRLALALEDGTVRVWGRKAGAEAASFRLTEPGKGRAGAVAYSADGKQLAAVGWGGVLTVWDAGTKKALFTHRDAHDFWADVVAFSANPELPLLATAGRDRTVKVWHNPSGSLVRTLWHPRDVKDLAFHPKA